MLPTDSAKRFLLQQHLLNSRFAPQFTATNEMQLQAPSLPSVSAAAAPSLQTIRPVPGLSRDNGAGFQAPPESNILHFLLAADQERRLKRRLSEMQQLRLSDIHQQIQLQRNQQHHQHAMLLQSTLGRVDRASRRETSALPAARNKTSLANLGNDVASKVLHPLAGATALPSPGVAPVSHKEAAKEEAPKVSAKEAKTEGKKGPQPMAAQSSEKPSSNGSGVSRKDARWREMYEELIEYKNNHNGMYYRSIVLAETVLVSFSNISVFVTSGSCIVPRGFSENPRLASWVAEQR